MLFRSKTAINVRFQKLFNTKVSSKSFSQLFNFNGITSVETQKFSAITKLSNNYKTEQKRQNCQLKQTISAMSQLDGNCTAPPSGQIE